MMHLTNCGQIRLTRGDTCILPIEINAGTEFDPIKYELQENDAIYFALMEPNQPFELAILKKKLTSADIIDGNLSILIKSKDTMCLLPGLYYYQIKIKIYNPDRDDYIVNTVIPKTQFWIME